LANRSLLAICLVLLPACGLTEAARFLKDALRPAEELREGVAEHTDTLAGERVRFYRALGSNEDTPYLVLCAGAVQEGIDEPRFVALARALARRGLVVATPELQSLRAFRIDSQDPVRIARVVRALPTDRPVGLAGISIGGSYCLVAATLPEIRDRIPCVFSFGGYADLEVLLYRWLTAPAPDAPGLLDPHAEGREAVLRGNRDRIPPALLEATMASNASLSGEQATRLLSGLREDLVALSPTQAPGVPSARIFLLHGAEDLIVPTNDARRLNEYFTRHQVRVRLLITDLFSHVDAGDPSLIESLPLLRFVAAFLDAARSTRSLTNKK